MRRGLVLIEPSHRFSQPAAFRDRGGEAARSREQIRGVFFFFSLQAHGDVCSAGGGRKKDSTLVRALLRNLIKLRRNVVFLRSEVSGRVYSRGSMLMGLFM